MMQHDVLQNTEVMICDSPVGVAKCSIEHPYVKQVCQYLESLKSYEKETEQPLHSPDLLHNFLLHKALLKTGKIFTYIFTLVNSHVSV